MKSNTAKLLAVLLLAVLLRSIGLNSRGIWYDDAFSIFLSKQAFGAIISGTAADTMPPLYYFVLHAVMQISQELWLLRLPNLIFSTAGVALLYVLMARLLNPEAGLWAAFLAAISPFQIYHAQEMRSYALLALAELGYIWFFTRIWMGPKRPGWKDWAGLVFCGTAAMYSHNLAAFIMVVPNLYLVYRRDWSGQLRLLAAQAVIGLLTLPWLIYLPGQIEKIQGGWSIPLPGLVEIIQSIVIFTSNLPLPGMWLAVGLLISLWVAALLGFELLRERNGQPSLYLLAAVVIIPPVLMLIVSYLLRPVYVTRGFILSALAFDGLAGYVIARRWPGIGMLFVGLFIGGAVIALPYQYTYGLFPRSPYREAGQYLQQVYQPGDRVVNDNKLSYFPIAYYQPQLPQEYIRDLSGGHNDTLAYGSEKAMGMFSTPDMPSAVGEAERVYFVVFTQAISEYRAMGEDQHPTLAWLDQRYHLVERRAFNDLEIYRYEQ